MVAIVCPVATAVMGFGGPYKSVLFFARKKKGFDRVEFMKMLDQHFEESIHGGLIAYVEGTRNQRRIPKRLKSGVIQYSYDRKIRAQVPHLISLNFRIFLAGLKYKLVEMTTG